MKAGCSHEDKKKKKWYTVRVDLIKNKYFWAGTQANANLPL